MKLKLTKTCPCGKAGETVDVESVDNAQALVLAGAAEEVPSKPVAPVAPTAAKSGKKKAAKKAK